jgi:hypothetical protein
MKFNYYRKSSSLITYSDLLPHSCNASLDFDPAEDSDKMTRPEPVLHPDALYTIAANYYVLAGDERLLHHVYLGLPANHWIFLQMN